MRRALPVALFGLFTSTAAVQALEPASAPAALETGASDLGERTYLLWFTDEPVTDVAQAVLGDALGLEVRADPSVTQVMSFRVDRPMTREALIAEFRDALAAEGVYVSRSGETVALSTTPPVPVRAAPVAAPTRPVAPTRSDPPRVEAVEDAAGPGAWDGWPWMAGLAGLLAASALWVRSRAPRRAREPQGGFLNARPRALARLLEAHPVSADATARASVEAARRGVPLERALVLTGAASERALAEAYAAATGCALWRPAERPALSAGALAPALAGRLHDARCVPLEVEPRLVVAVDDPVNVGSTFALAEETGRPVIVMVGTISDVADALGEPRPPANTVEPALEEPPAGALAPAERFASQ